MVSLPGVMAYGETVEIALAHAQALVLRTLPDGQALAKAKEIAGVIAENEPLAVEAVLETLHRTDGMTEAEAMAFDLKVGLPIFGTSDAKEGPRAFAGKRKPRFTRS